jgi:uncharacterized protein involved in exopolysaccharide biosynthesis
MTQELTAPQPEPLRDLPMPAMPPLPGMPWLFRPETAERDALSVSLVLDAVQLHWRRIALAGAAAAVAAWALASLLSPQFQGVALVRVDNDGLGVLDDDKRDPNAFVDPLRVQSRVQAIAGLDVLSRAAYMAGLRYYPQFNPELRYAGKPDPAGKALAPQPDTPSTLVERDVVNALGKALSVSQVKQSTVAEIAVKAPDPWLAARAANAIADAYLEHQVLERRAQRLQALDALAAQREELNARLKGLEQEIVRTRADSKLVFSETNDVAGNVFANIREQLVVSEAELAAATTKREILDGARSAGAGASELSEVAFSALIQALRQRRMQAYMELADAAEVYGPRHPEYLRKQESLAKIDGAIARELESVSATVRNEERVVLTKVAKLRQRMKEIESEATEGTGSKVRIARLQSEADATKESLQRLGNQIDTISTRVGLEEATASIVSRAIAPEHPVFPNKLFIAGVASVAGAGFAFLFVAARALRDKRIRTIAQLRSFEGVSGYPVVAALPHLENGLDPANVSLESPYVRSVLGLATTVGIGSSKIGRVVVAPVRPGDGSTSLAVSLALLCRSRGLKTLLVELNADRAITRMFGGEGYLGLADCSKQGIDPESTIWITEEQGLQIIGYGATGGELDYQTMGVIEQAFDRLFAHYDVVILDAPPLTSTKHAYRLMQETDRLLVVTLPDGGRADILGYNLRSLAVGAAAKVAVVFNQVPSNSELLVCKGECPSP